MSTKALEIEHIRAARARAAGLVKTTPLDLSATFSTLCGRQIYLKLENLQKTGAFKVRGALNKIQMLDAATRARGVVTASAGNHAQGVAYAARMLAVPVTVVMPETASFSKSEATKGYGAEVVSVGRDYLQACEHATRLAEERRATFVHAFDDADVIAGQGTLGLELIEQLADFDTVVVPVGGGGLLAGVASALRGSGSTARIIGVQARGASTLVESLAAGECLRHPIAATIADGLATGGLGELPFAILRRLVDDAVEVSDAEIAAAIVLLLERAKMVVEGAGAAGLAACLAGRLPPGTGKVVVVLSGGNIDLTLLDRIINIGLAGEGRRMRFSALLPDSPGEILRLVACVAAQRANLRHLVFDRSRRGVPPLSVVASLDVETRGPEHVRQLETALVGAGFERFGEGD